MPMDAGSVPDPLVVCIQAARAGGQVLSDWRGKFAVSRKGPRDFVTEADYAAQREVRRVVAAAFPTHGFVGEEADAGAGQPPSGAPGHSGQGLRWIVDPLDGTSNYVHDFPAYCVSVALAQADELLVGAIYDPVRDECFTARKGGGARLDDRPIHVPDLVDPGEALAAVSFPPQVTVDSQAVADFLAVLPHVHTVRRTGSTALNLAYVACGRLHAFWVRRIACWDVAAGLLIAREAGAAIGPCDAAAEPGEPVPLDSPGLIAASSPQVFRAVRDMLHGRATASRSPDADH
jgi:myo-inositol-1(or 4)-monophosphatase